MKHATKGFPPSSRVCVERNNDAKGENPFTSRLCGRKHAGKGFPPSCCVCVEGNNDAKGENPFTSRLCGRKHAGKGFPPSHRVCFVFIVSVRIARAKPSFLQIGV